MRAPPLVHCVAAVVLIAGFVASCGVRGNCSPGTCAGCCDAAGMCQNGTSTSACGSSGVACDACTAFETCTLGLCIGGSGTGGGSGVGGGTGVGGGGGGTAPCTSANCAGCCDGSGRCQFGDANTACGRGAQTCANCTQFSAVCLSGQCVSGSGGGGGSGCDRFSCPTGCCITSSSDGCMPGTQSNACGSGGAACQFCGSSQTCSNQRCATGGGAGGGGGTSCNGSTCPDGCCSATGSCEAGTSVTACGFGGQLCSTCTPLVGACQNQQCVIGGAGGGGGTGCTPATTASGSLSGRYGGSVGSQDELTIALRRSPLITSTFEQSSFEMWWGTSVPALPYTETYSTSKAWNSCTACVTYDEGCTDSSSSAYPYATCSRRFFARSGSFTVNTASRATTGSMSGSHTDLTLVEWDFVTDAPVPGGQCRTLPAGSFSVSY